MTPRQRVHAALNRLPADRIPIFMWYHPVTARRLAAELDIPVSELSTVMGDDVRQTWVGNNHAMEGIVHERDGETHRDDWGIEWVKSGHFNQIRSSPLEHASREEALAYQYPYNCVDSLMANMVPLLRYSDRYFIGCDVSPCLFEMICRLRGMEQATLDLAEDPDLARTMLAEAGAFSRHLAEEACRRFRLDWLWTGDDVGGQLAMIMSPSLWRELVKPRLKEIFAAGKTGGIPVAYHSCGAVRDIIPDLIEIGLDVLNPIQCNCPGMDPASLKREFGRKLTFMGGVDTQGLLPQATADEVFRVTRKLIEIMTEDGGGYILAASHTIPPETPSENIFAMYDAAGLSREAIADAAADARKRGAGLRS
ncbi:MAG TPA: uroporphyrinogen decarboxylase family protein [Candidatus Latescibacteria bacterium]|nr:uroporphyrinogen decarboxylase family protein [Candidatus Latescibacterota bacterium]